MAQGNLPATTAVNPSTKTLGELMADAAAIVGAQDNPAEVRALSAIHRSLDWIQNHDWEIMLKNGSTFTSVIGTATYALGNNHRKIHSMRTSSGTERKIHYIRKTDYDSRVSHQSVPGLPVWYSMHKQGDLGVITLLPTPDQVEDFEYIFYRDISRPVNESAIIGNDFPREWEDMLISRAGYLIAIGRGLRTDRLQMLRQDSEVAKQDALMRDTNEFDEDIVMTSGSSGPGGPVHNFDDASRWF